MAHPLINRALYDAIIHFDEDETAQEYFYKVMDTPIERGGKTETVRCQILRVYAMLFCDVLGAEAGHIATAEDVEATADRLYLGSTGFDPRHWYRMRHHFPVIDEDNYDRFAALVIADLNAGELKEAAVSGGDMLLVGELNPLSMTAQQRREQKVSPVTFKGEQPV